MNMKHRGRVLPPNYKHIIEIESFRKLTLRERFWIMLGFNLTIKTDILTEHKPGKFETKHHLRTTKALDGKGEMEERRK